MEASQRHGDQDPPQVIVSQPTTELKKSRLSALKKIASSTNDEGQSSGSGGARGILYRRPTLVSRKKEKHIQIETPLTPRPVSLANASSIYRGSFAPSPSVSRPVSVISSRQSVAATPRHSMTASQVHLEDLEYLLRDLDLELETYGIEENRDGFFDGMFLKPPRTDEKDLMKMAEYTLPASFRKRHPLSISQFLPKQWHELKSVLRRITTTRAGIKLAKSFLGVYIAYILCLVPAIGSWIGRYRYIMVLSAIFNHPGRTVGAQIDGALLSITGTATGLGWGALALYVSDSSSIAESGYGGLLATFLMLFMGSMAAMRSYFIRLYQFAVPAGIAAIFTCLAETGRSVTWDKLLAYGIPWLLGQAICLLVSFVVIPDGGSRPIAVALHRAFSVMEEGLVLPRTNNLSVHRQLAWTFVNLSQAYRDLSLDISFTRFAPSDIIELRNAMQAVIRSLLSLKTETELFKEYDGDLHQEESSDEDEIAIDIDGSGPRPTLHRSSTETQAVKLVTETLAQPTSHLLSCMREALARCNAVLLGMSGYRRYIGPPENVSSDVIGALTALRKATTEFDKLHQELIHNADFPATYSNYPEVVQLFLFLNPVRQTANSLELLLVLVMNLQQRHRRWRFYLPQYPFFKALQRTNAQVRHDRGGLTTGLFFRSQKQLNELMYDSQKSTFQPLPRHKSTDNTAPGPNFEDGDDDDVLMDDQSQMKKTFRYKLWRVLHRMQGFEMRFALKVAIVVSLLSVPAWLTQSRQWYNEHQSWWAVIFTWIVIHPRTGGNVQDLFTRSFCALLGAVWGGFAYGARNGNPYVIAVFAAIYMIPMIYRFTQSSHPRSGLVGCVSFVIVSLNANIGEGNLSIVDAAWAHGVAFIVGVMSAILISWMLWPFIARHELRKSLSLMIYYLALIYRGVVAQYIYYEEGEAPTKADITRSEMLEGRLREGFVRMRHLLALTRHEVRLREPFNPLPYSALIENCESFFEHLVEVRQFSLYFHPHYMSQNEEASKELLPFRRDAVASILMNLYILAGALRGNRKVPRYLPSAAAARQGLLAKMAEVEFEQAEMQRKKTGTDKRREEDGMRFAQVYQFAYSKGLTQCVEQLEHLQNYTKAICGEVGFNLGEFAEDDHQHFVTRKL